MYHAGINLGSKFPTKPAECKYLYSGTETKYLRKNVAAGDGVMAQ